MDLLSDSPKVYNRFWRVRLSYGFIGSRICQPFKQRRSQQTTSRSACHFPSFIMSAQLESQLSRDTTHHFPPAPATNFLFVLAFPEVAPSVGHPASMWLPSHAAIPSHPQETNVSLAALGAWLCLRSFPVRTFPRCGLGRDWHVPHVSGHTRDSRRAGLLTVSSRLPVFILAVPTAEMLSPFSLVRFVKAPPKAPLLQVGPGCPGPALIVNPNVPSIGSHDSWVPHARACVCARACVVPHSVTIPVVPNTQTQTHCPPHPRPTFAHTSLRGQAARQHGPPVGEEARHSSWAPAATRGGQSADMEWKSTNTAQQGDRPPGQGKAGLCLLLATRT